MGIAWYRMVNKAWAFLVLGSITVSLMAQDGDVDAGGAGGGADQMPDSGFADIVFGGGFVAVCIWLLIFLVSFATITLIVYGFINTKREKFLPIILVTAVRESLDDGDLGAAMAACEQNPGPLSNILLAGFSAITEGFDAVQEAVHAATDLESEKVMQQIAYLNLCGQLSPMLGLLGTVTGMVGAFKSLGMEAGESKAVLLALAISRALWTTVAGLLIAVPALLGYAIFRNVAIRMLLECQATVLDLMKILRSAEVEEEDEELYEEEP